MMLSETVIKKLDRQEKKIERLLSMSRQQLKNERAILWESSDHDPRFAPKDGREATPIRRIMVDFAINFMDRNPTLSSHAAAMNLIEKFKTVDGAYTMEELDSFRRQINLKSGQTGKK